jgi:gliding motility-associated-like protein
VNLKLLFFIVLITISSIAQNKNKTIGFKENKGQIIDQKGKPNNAVKYLLNSGGLNVQLRKNGFSYDVYEVKKLPIKNCQNEKKRTILSKDNEKLPDYTLEYQYHRIDIDFVNSNPKVTLITEEKSLDYDNYYNVPNKPEGVLMVHQYKQITYKNIYPNIDVVFSVPKDTLKTVEYNFVVHPKGKISDIQLKFSGAQTELVDNKIRMTVRFGEMEETLPMSWTEDGELKKEILVRYTKIKKNVYGFASSNSVDGKTIVIDPVPIRLWGTYYGGEGEENRFNGIVKIKNDYVYIGGYTGSLSNIATAGTQQTTANTPYDAFIAKFDNDGNRIWGTYYGGSHDDIFREIAFDANNNFYAVGYTGSNTNISTINSHQNIYNEKYDGMLIKFNENGQRIWGTYYGGENHDEIYSVKVDKNQNIYIGGYSTSLNNIATPNSFRDTVEKTTYTNQMPDGFLAKFTSNGNLQWATYYGNTGADAIYSIDLDSNNNIFCSGITNGSSEGLSTSGAYDESLNGSWDDTFVVKFNPNGERKFGTYYGGGDYDRNDFIKVDHDDNFIISGDTRSVDGIGNLNSQQPIKGGYYNSDFDSYIAKFDNDGKLLWSTYYGGEEDDGGNWGNKTDVDENNNIYFYSSGYSKNNISTPDAYQTERGLYNGSVYIVKFDQNGQRIWGSYYGSDSHSGQICYAGKGAFYISGWTNGSPDFTTPGAYQNNINGGYDSFLVKFQDCQQKTTLSTNSSICVGNAIELKASGGTNYAWTGPNGFTSADQNPTIPNATALNNGKYSCNITGTGGCDGIFTADVLVGDIVAPIPNLTNLPTITGDCHTIITTIPTATDACAGAITAITASPLSYSLPGTYTVIWDYDDRNGNISHQNQTVTINSQPLPTATSPQTLCIQQNATLNDIVITTGQNIKWYNSLTVGNLLPNTTLLQNGKTFYASQTINGCESERIPVIINIQNTFAPTGNTNQTFCTGQNPTIANILVTGSSIKWYDAASNGYLLPETTNLQNGKTYYASQTINNCESPRFGITVSIVNTPNAPTANGNQAFCKSGNTTLNHIQILGQNIKWYDTNSSAASLSNTTLLENNKTYYASQTVGCESARTAVLIQINVTPLPTGSNNQQFCIDENATIANLNITGTNLKWYDSAINGNISPESPLQNGVYYTTQTLNNCESERYAVTVKVQDTQIPMADSPQLFCIQKNALIRDINIMGQNIKWFENISSTVNLPESTLLKDGVTYYASQTANNCESDRIPIIIEILTATTADCINFEDELPFPKFFTPNNDGYNDTWTIDFAYLAPNTGIRIFDRYGKLITVLSVNSSWDGNYSNHPLPSTDYWFTITRLNGAEFKSHFSLKR